MRDSIKATNSREELIQFRLKRYKIVLTLFFVVDEFNSHPAELNTMDKLRKELSGAFQSHPDEMRQILLDLLNRPPSSPTAGHARRPGRGGSLQCARCRRHKNGGKVC